MALPQPPGDRLRLAAGAILALVLASGPALAAEGVGKPSEIIFLGQVLALVFVGRLFGEAMLRVGQPAVVGQLLAGIALGPSVFGALLPDLHALVFPADHAQKAMVDGVAELGVMLLLLLTGMETDVGLVRRVGRAAAAVSLTGIAVPFGLGLALGLGLLPDSLLPAPDKRLVTAMFLGTALSISSIKIVAMVVDEMNFMRRDLGQIIVASAIIDDTIGWILIAVTFGLARPGGFDYGHLALSVGGTLLFLLVSLTLGRRAVAWLMRWANDSLRSDYSVATIVLLVMGSFALVTAAIGVQPVLGAYVAGVLVGQSPILTRQAEGQIRGLVIALFAPIFFGIAGLGTDLTVLHDPKLLGLTVLLILIASAGKFGGAFLGGTAGGLSRDESLALALGMNARGSTEVIVASIGLSIGALTDTLFTMIVTMAVATTTAMPPTLRWALGRLPLREDESKRLDQEKLAETGFVGQIERALLVHGEGASGRLAARLTGLLAGGQAWPVTVMPLGKQAGSSHVEAVRTHAARVPTAETEAGPDPIDVIMRLPDAEVGSEAAAVSAEARKGYGLLALGIEPATLPTGGINPRLASLIASADDARAVVIARGSLRAQPAEAPLRLLVPMTGTAAGRRAAELALSLAQAQRLAVTLLFVADSPIAARRGLRPGRTGGQQPRHSEMMDDMRDLARRFDVEAETVVRVADDKLAAILGQVRRAEHTLIVLGVQARTSEAAPFGVLAAGLLEGADQSLMLVLGRDPSAVSSKA